MTEDQVQGNANACEWVMSQEERDLIDGIAAWEGTGEEVERFGMGPNVPSAPIR